MRYVTPFVINHEDEVLENEVLEDDEIEDEVLEKDEDEDNNVMEDHNPFDDELDEETTEFCEHYRRGTHNATIL